MVINKHYITYPFLILVAAAALYFTGVQHQKQRARDKFVTDSLTTQAKEIITAKAKTDSIARDSIFRLQNKVLVTKQITAGLGKQRASLWKGVLGSQDTAQLITAL